MRKKLVTIFLCITLCMSLMPTVVSAASGRKKVTKVSATAEIVLPEYGAAPQIPTFKVTEGTEVYFSPSMISWCKDDVAVRTNFDEGDYYLCAQIRIDGDNGSKFEFNNALKVYVNGVQWTVFDIQNYDEYCWAWVKSPITTVKMPEGFPLNVEVPSSYFVDDGLAGTKIDNLDISKCVLGGKKPYQYSISAGPDWLSISSEGILSGTRPERDLDKTEITILVKDNNDDSKTITLKVGQVVVPAEVSVVRATSNIIVPEPGAQVIIPKFTVDADSPAFFATSNGGWMSGDTRITGTFGNEDYHYETQVRLDGIDGVKYNFSDSLKVYVDDVEWEVSSISNYPTYSFAWVVSPVIVKPDDEQFTVSFNMNGHGDSVEDQQVYSGKLAKNVTDVHCDGWYFQGWCEDPECTVSFDFSTPITSDITLYAKWVRAALNKWIETAEGWFFIDENGIAVTGFKELSGSLYYFDFDGLMVTDWFCVDGEWYYAKANGQLAIGWLKLSDRWYYFDAEGRQCEPGWLYINGCWYFFDDDSLGKGILALGWVYDEAGNYYFDKNGNMVKGWVEYDGSWFYFESNGKQCVMGWKKINNVWYFFDEDVYPYGVMHTGWLYDYTNDIYYYLNSNGSMATGWIKDDGVWYYMNSDGSMKTGWLKSGNTWYFMNDNGSMATGWKLLGGVWYYFDANGSMVTGSKTINGKTYYFDESGHCTNP